MEHFAGHRTERGTPSVNCQVRRQYLSIYGWKGTPVTFEARVTFRLMQGQGPVTGLWLGETFSLQVPRYIGTIGT